MLLHAFEGRGTATLEIELLPGLDAHRGIDCRLVLASGHVEPVLIQPRHARMLHRLVGYRVADRAASVSESLQGFRSTETISADTAREFRKISPQAVADYAKKIRKAVRASFENAREHEPTLQYVDPIQFLNAFGVRLNGIPIRIIDHEPSSVPGA